MAIIHNKIGSLSTINKQLTSSGLSEFNTIRAILNFRNRYNAIMDDLINVHQTRIRKEMKLLPIEIKSLDQKIEDISQDVFNKYQEKILRLTNELSLLSLKNENQIFKQIINKIDSFFLKQSMLIKILRRDKNIKSSTRLFVLERNKKIERLQYIIHSFQKAVDDCVAFEKQKIQAIKHIIEENNSFILGAMGEQLVENLLKNLPDEFHIINDFSISFYCTS